MKKNIIRIFFLVSLLFLVSGLAFAETMTYKELNKKQTTYEVKIDTTPTGFIVDSTDDSGEVSEYKTDLLFANFNWNYCNPTDNTQISAHRSGDVIDLKGIFKGKKFASDFKIDNNPWYQQWGLSMEAFARSNKTAINFWSINPKDFKMIAKFQVSRLGDETIQIQGQQIETVHLRVALAGLLAPFFQADFWLRKTDTRSIRSRMPLGPGLPSLVTELISERS